MIIGIVGTIGGGKDTVADYLKSRGFEHASLSDTLREMMKKEGTETTIPNMIEYGNKLRAKKGNDILARLAFKKISGKNAVLTSIRQTGEIEYLRKQPEFVLIKVDAPIKDRFKRIIARNRDGDIKTMEELIKIEKQQASGVGSDINMNRCFDLCQYEIINDGTKDDLFSKIDNFLEVENAKKKS